ncbi:DUF1269 domain-containing protein [Rhodopirellula bahusiensis]|uniref:DUF1269 domain-containing protein n=1 Tax=Rhodopirellula bahusiensis TaxID=2014065 RepID=A0A2G1W1Q2_9BACT|nr:DUF1269 domain-containing protein [Rhodopirellula bahusiensis]PHQ32915.1 DUF1269 domain-containing protein [Rhodopirellula bahusiensis]
MGHQCLVAEYATREKLAVAVEALQKDGYGADDFSVVTPSDQSHDVANEGASNDRASSPPAEKTTGAATLAGGAIGALLAAPTMIGPFLVAGPIAGMAAGAVGGGLLASMKTWGLDDKASANYETNLNSGSSLIVIEGDKAKLNAAAQTLQTCDPVSIDRYEA